MNTPAPKTATAPDEALSSLMGAALDVPAAPEQPEVPAWAPDNTLARTGNTEKEQAMWFAGMEQAQANAQDNAAIRGAAPASPVSTVEQADAQNERSATHGMTLGERIAHVGGRTNAQGYIEFGSPMAVDALIEQVLRDIDCTRQDDDGAYQARYRVPGGQWSSWGHVVCGVKGHEQELRYIPDGHRPAPAVGDALTAAARDVLAERKRQVSNEGWTPERDDQYTAGDMASAAACYASQGRYHYPEPGEPGPNWPWAAEWWKPSTYRRNLEKAGALILAEIERLDRAAIAAQQGKGGAA